MRTAEIGDWYVGIFANFCKNAKKYMDVISRLAGICNGIKHVKMKPGLCYDAGITDVGMHTNKGSYVGVYIQKTRTPSQKSH